MMTMKLFVVFRRTNLLTNLINLCSSTMPQTQGFIE